MKAVISRRLLLGLYLIPLLFYQYLYFKSYFPVVEGWYSEYGHLIRSGSIPYRDFSLAFPPLYALQIAGVQSLFGEQFIVLRYLGVVFTCGIGFLLFLILRQICNEWVAAFAANIALIYYQSNTAYINYDYHQPVTLYMLLACLCLLHYVKQIFSPAFSRHIAWLCLAIGVMLGLSLLASQSTGGIMLIILAVVTALIALRILPFPIALKHGLLMFASIGIPILPIIAWLAANGALGDFISSVSTQAIASKGGVLVSLTNWQGNFDLRSFFPHSASIVASLALLLLKLVFLSVIAGLAVSRKAAWQKLRHAWKMQPQDGNIDIQAFIVCGVAIAALLWLIFSIYNQDCAICGEFGELRTTLYDAVVLYSVDFYLLGLVASACIFYWKPGHASAQYFVLLAFGFGLLEGNGTSGGLCEISAYFAVAMLIAYLIQCSFPYIVPAALPVTIALVFSSYFIGHKFYSPYNWWYSKTEDVRHECADAKGLFAGLCLPQEQYDKMMRIARDIDGASKADEPVYVFSGMPVFYLLADRAPFAGAVTSWFDVMNDRQSRDISDKLLATPPAVIVMARIPEEAFATHEKLFRNGNKLGQRDIVDAVSRLESEKHIARIDTIEDVTGITFDVYARK